MCLIKIYWTPSDAFDYTTILQQITNVEKSPWYIMTKTMLCTHALSVSLHRRKYRPYSDAVRATFLHYGGTRGEPVIDWYMADTSSNSRAAGWPSTALAAPHKGQQLLLGAPSTPNPLDFSGHQACTQLSTAGTKPFGLIRELNRRAKFYRAHCTRQ